MSLLDKYFKTKDIAIKKKLNLGDLQDNKVLMTSQFLTNAYYNFMRMGESDLPSVVSELNSMYRDPIISNALELIVDDATGISHLTNKRVWVSTSHEYIETTLDNFFNDISIQEKVRFIVNRVVLLGNCAIRLYYKEKSKENGAVGGIEYIEIEEDIFRYTPIEINGVLIKYYDKYTQELLEPYEILFIKYESLYDANQTDQLYGVYNNNVKKNENKNTWKYGISMFENVRRLWRQLKILEDSLILSRLEFSPILRIIKAKVDKDADSKDVKAYIDRISDLFTAQKTISTTDSILKNEPFNSFGATVVLPMLEGQGVEIEDKGGNVDVTSIVDIELFLKKFYSALKVPKEYLGLGDDAGGITIGETSILRKEIRYSRMVRRLQYTIIQSIKKLSYYHLLSLNKDIKFEDFDCMMMLVSSAEEEEYRNTMNKGIDSVKAILEFVNEIKTLYSDGELSKKSLKALLDYITTTVLSSYDFNWQELFDDLQVPSDEENPEGDVSPDEIMTDETPQEGSATEPPTIQSQPTVTQQPKNFSSNNFKANNFKVNSKESKMLFMLSGLKSNSQKKVIRLLEKMTIPKFDYSADLKYIKESFNKNGSKKYIVETTKKLSFKEFKNRINEISNFSIDILNLKYKPIDIPLYEFKIKSKIDNSIDIKDVIFTESMYSVKDIMNYKKQKSISLYKMEGDLYINYDNAVNLLKHVIEDTKYDIEVLELSK